MAWQELKEVSKSETNKANTIWYDSQVDLTLVRKPERFIYCFTISRKSFIISRPPLFPMLRVPACPKDQKYVMFAKIPDPFVQAIQNTENGRLRGEAHDGLRVAIDLTNPNNISTNPDWECPIEFQGEITTGYGCDLSRHGLFISENETPTDFEVKKAETKRHRYFEELRKEVDLTPASEIMYKVRMNDDFGLMADYFQISYTWHQKQTAYETCPNCDAAVPQGAAFHAIGNNICVIDWPRTVEAGLKTKADAEAAGYGWPKVNAKPSGSK